MSRRLEIGMPRQPATRSRNSRGGGGKLRIIAGELRGRRIVVPPCGVRPTPDRVREALFSILGERVRGACVLDAYSGSGGLGFEALSRGAARIVFIEAQPEALATLERNVWHLGAGDRCSILAGEVQRLLGGRASAADRYDLILADPPYATDEAAGFLVLAHARLAAGGLIVLEREVGREPTVPPGLCLLRTARYGRTCLDLLRGDPPRDP